MRCFLATVALLVSLPAAAFATTHELDPDDLEAQFQRGMAAVGQAIATPDADHRDALLDEAIAAFHGMLVANPGLVRVRLELAHAFFLKGEDSLARQHFEEVLAGDVPPAVRANVNLFLAEIRARRRWSFNLGFALAPDTNIGATSEERIIYIYGLPFERDAEDLATSGVGLSAWLSGEYQYPLGDRRRLRAGADVSQRDYAGSRFDQTFVSVHGGPRWLVGTNAEASMLASAQRRWLGGGQFYDAYGARLEAARRISGQVTTFARASYHDRSYRTETHLDGPVADIILGGVWIVRSTVRADGALGWGQERTEVERWRHQRKWLRLGVSVALPLGFTVGGSGEMRWTDYEGNWHPHTLGGEPREDRTRSLRLSVYNRAFAWRGFSPRLSLVHEVRETNAQLYDYRRTGGELSLVRVF
ncbi:MAG: surface lipoprotein assembly modifier [Rhodospirillales bacterium]|nr:surface lipoprotein assembly modifier [Rhodospirillales bacterium]